MATKNRRAGTISFKRNGVLLDAKGNFSYSLGTPKREAIVGADRVHGFRETPTAPMLEGEITDRGDLSLREIFLADDDTISLQVGNGKTIAFRSAFYTGDGKIQTEEANVEVSYGAMSAEEILA